MSHYIITGPAGSGKTTTALRIAMQQTKSKGYVTVIRNVVPVRDLGFLPGTLEEKTQAYFEPYRPFITSLKKQNHFTHGRIRYETTSFLRGKTFENGVVILDEAQNLTYQELYTVLTRIGVDCTLLVVGDQAQSDLPKAKDREGFFKFVTALAKCKNVKLLELKENFRSPLLDEYHQKIKLAQGLQSRPTGSILTELDTKHKQKEDDDAISLGRHPPRLWGQS